MSEPMTAGERYLAQLADALEALGPGETSEVLSEVWSHINDAMFDSGEEEEAVIARFGSPEVLAARILEERGFARGGLAVPEAGNWRKVAAVVMDAALWLVAVWLFLVPFLSIPVYGLGGYVGAIIAGVALAALLGIAAWWWAKKRRERGYVSVGMRAMGLRRIRVGDAIRLVREHDVPGPVSRKGGRVVAAAGAVLALLILFSLTYSALAGRSDDRQNEMRQAVGTSGGAVYLVTSLYQEAMVGLDSRAVESPYAPSAEHAWDELLARRDAGLLDSYAIADMDLLAITVPEETTPVGADQAVVSVSVMEYNRDSDVPEFYDYRVGVVMEAKSENGWALRYVIQSVEGPR